MFDPWDRPITNKDTEELVDYFTKDKDMSSYIKGFGDAQMGLDPESEEIEYQRGYTDALLEMNE